VIWVFGKTEYFFKRGWTGFREASPSGKSHGNRGGLEARRFSHAPLFAASRGLLLAKS
jgi:hypothetical protein